MNELKRNQYVALRSYLINQSPHMWLTSGQINADLGIAPKQVRRICQEHPAEFVSSTDGYKSVGRANKEEIQHCVTTLIQRSNKMLVRASALSAKLT